MPPVHKQQCSKEDLEQFYNQKIILADREFTEQKTKEIIQQAKTKKVAFLVIGDPFSATTHIELFRQAKENKGERWVMIDANKPVTDVEQAVWQTVEEKLGL